MKRFPSNSSTNPDPFGPRTGAWSDGAAQTVCRPPSVQIPFLPAGWLARKSTTSKTAMNQIHKTLLATLVALGATSGPVLAETVGFYIGIDSRNPLASGTYRGLDNPNFGRLTLLYAHTYNAVPGLAPAGVTTFAVNHYHPIGAYTLSGPTNAPVALDTSSNNRIPEPSRALPGLTLLPSTNALFSGKLVNARTMEDYSDMRWRSTHDLNQPAIHGPGSPEFILFHSSAGTRTNSLAGAVVALELISKTDGLNIGSLNTLNVLTHPGDRFVIGEGNSINFQPMFWTEADAPVGRYSATFKLVDVSTAEGHIPFLESGTFSLDFRVVPEPTIAIAPSVTLHMPRVTQAHVLETAPSPDGPWTPVGNSGARFSGDQQMLTLPANQPNQLFRLRKP